MNIENGQAFSIRESLTFQIGRVLAQDDNTESVHASLGDVSAGRAIEAKPSDGATVVALPRIGGLHHRSLWRRAA
jgi:hypothetical protein